MTLKQFAEILKELVDTNENIGSLSFPIDFQDSSVETIEAENLYQEYLRNNQYDEAEKYRLEHPELESRIFDSAKANLLQTLGLTSFQYAKEERSASNLIYDNSETRINANNLQDALDYVLLNHKSYELLTESQYEDKGNIVNTDGIVYYVK